MPSLPVQPLRGPPVLRRGHELSDNGGAAAGAGADTAMSTDPIEPGDAEPLYSSDDLAPALPASAYLDPAHFAREREAIFFREWSCVGRDL